MRYILVILRMTITLAVIYIYIEYVYKYVYNAFLRHVCTYIYIYTYTTWMLGELLRGPIMGFMEFGMGGYMGILIGLTTLSTWTLKVSVGYQGVL